VKEFTPAKQYNMFYIYIKGVLKNEKQFISCIKPLIMSLHNIPLETAVEMTTRFRDNRNSILQETYQNEDILPLCETFSKSAIEDLLSQDGCDGFRIYYGMDENLKIHAILVGVNGDDEDILEIEEAEGVILEDGQRCPPSCPPTSPLNSGE
jgi:hypothetical protein